MSRKTTRQPQKTQRLGIEDNEGHDDNEGNDVNTAEAGTSTTAPKKGKSSKPKPGKRAKHSEEEAGSYDDSDSYTASDTDDSTGNVLPVRRKASYRRRRPYITVKPPTWDGQKTSWPEFEEQFRLFLHDVNRSWDIETTVFSKRQDKEIYGWLMRAEKASTGVSTAYKVMYPQHIDQGQTGFKALRQYCMGTQQAMVNNNLLKMVNYRLLPTMKVMDWAVEMKRVEAQLMKAGVIPKPVVGIPSVIVAFHMSYMPPKFNNLMTIIRQRSNTPLPNLPEFIDLLLAEEEAAAARASQGTSMQQPGAPFVQEVGSFSAAPSGVRGRWSKKQSKRRGGGGGRGGGVWSTPHHHPAAASTGHRRPAAAAPAPPPHPTFSRHAPYQPRAGGRGRGSGFSNFRGHRDNNRGRGFTPNFNPNSSSSQYCRNHKSTGHSTADCRGVRPNNNQM